MRRSFSRRTQVTTACLPAVASAEGGAAVDQKHDGWEAVTPPSPFEGERRKFDSSIVVCSLVSVAPQRSPPRSVQI